MKMGQGGRKCYTTPERSDMETPMYGLCAWQAVLAAAAFRRQRRSNPGMMTIERFIRLDVR